MAPNSSQKLNQSKFMVNTMEVFDMDHHDQMALIIFKKKKKTFFWFLKL
jgi:hypothetical protein